MQTSKMLMMIGSALAKSELGQSVGAIELNDVLGVMGLARRRSDLGQNLLLLGVGAAVGAGVALLWAPASGSETRKRLSQTVEKLGEQAVAALEEVQSGAPATARRSNHRSGSVG
ncbi:MAG: YtxH domain-containing protein [Myxococcales bacterium]